MKVIAVKYRGVVYDTFSLYYEKNKIEAVKVFKNGSDLRWDRAESVTTNLEKVELIYN